MRIGLPYTADDLVGITLELLRKCNYREDAYMRPTLYKSTEAIGVRLHNLEAKLNIIAIPFGEYISIDHGISAQTVSWRRTNDVSIPSRAKIVGSIGIDSSDPGGHSGSVGSGAPAGAKSAYP